jgi:magnesium chelatase family protein
VGLAATEGLIRPEFLADYLIMGELSLDGRVKGVQGVLPTAFLAREMAKRGVIVPDDNALEAAMVEGIEVIGVGNLADVVGFFRGEKVFTPLRVNAEDLFQAGRSYLSDFSEIKGQAQAKRALEIAAAGQHNALMTGPPGSGKTMLAQRLPTILPDWSFPEAIETTQIYSVAGLLNREEMIVRTRPFRAPHHSISDAGLVGGGHTPKPGEISLAHHGVLFLDEFPEFRKNALEALRQPLESGVITITRSTSTATYPARFMLLAAMNPCPCGYYGDTQQACRCSTTQIRQYQSKISGPLLDRIDIHIEVPSLRYRDLTSRVSAESSDEIRKRVTRARSLQMNRFEGSNTLVNAGMSERQIKKFCTIGEESHKLLEMAVDRLGMSARTFTRILKVARTIADLEEESHIQARHVAEAIQYRNLDRRAI